MALVKIVSNNAEVILVNAHCVDAETRLTSPGSSIAIYLCNNKSVERICSDLSPICASAITCLPVHTSE